MHSRGTDTRELVTSHSPSVMTHLIAVWPVHRPWSFLLLSYTSLRALAVRASTKPAVEAGHAQLRFRDTRRPRPGGQGRAQLMGRPGSDDDRWTDGQWGPVA